MAEVVGLVASVVQLAGAGLKLSQTLYQYADGVASADRRIKDIANEVKLTSFVIQELGAIFERDETANLISENAVRTANETIKECFAVFTELELKINKGKPGKMGRLMLPFKDNKIELLRSQIDKLKSTLELLMQVLIHAHQVSSEKYNREAEAKHREEIKQLLENKKQATKKYEESLRNFSISDGSTVVDDGDRSLRDKDDIDPSSDLFNTAGAIGSTINPDTLATCVDHVRSLLADIETLQLALAEQVNGDDHSDHHQKAIGSYFLARSHLDSVLLGKSQANVTDTQSQPWISKTSTQASVSATRDETLKDEDVGSSPKERRPSASIIVVDPVTPTSKKDKKNDKKKAMEADQSRSKQSVIRGHRQRENMSAQLQEQRRREPEKWEQPIRDPASTPPAARLQNNERLHGDERAQTPSLVVSEPKVTSEYAYVHVTPDGSRTRYLTSPIVRVENYSRADSPERGPADPLEIELEIEPVASSKKSKKAKKKNTGRTIEIDAGFVGDEVLPTRLASPRLTEQQLNDFEIVDIRRGSNGMDEVDALLREWTTVLE
ncbi:uncharacterized protein J4E92_001483 [Alternaria infectoria]|uniref:uncharacterized protein n=1 Tax=Alternaria infectoria TaxID=45303 RepID=UPI00221FA4CC|nr:uncharacterized protein J4E92_001483 [Alternaria infectoria]KAI4936758.1 hypothetical protein J4E92_001483 [Alternaria infectoria]